MVLGPVGHGVTRYAGEVAEAVGARVVRRLDRVTAGRPVHLHLTDRLFGRAPEDAARAVESLSRRVHLTVTLHDVPQPTDGPVFGARAAAYARMVRASRAWATNSWHEHALVHRWCAVGTAGTVIPLPVLVAGAPVADRETVRPHPVVGVFGYVYPGKGHRQVVRAVSAVRRGGTMARVEVLGGAAPGHGREVEALLRASADRGVPVEVTGRVPEADVVVRLRQVSVPVVAHRNVSASGSLNSWVAAGRRPLVRDGAYAREMAGLRPGTITLFDDSTLVPALESALARPASTWTTPGTDLAPGLEDTAAAYVAWWASADR
ncbi:hypothetical protein C7S10_16685 [Nocardioides currus]|uniref:Uncharacterized protein n=1 Tax=Nocardioides currus TaxID=2133958 RepID=A0A2R7YV09_9ACTN|nr:hypothetical protein C7S10_16685 [Nocardioides currus]